MKKGRKINPMLASFEAKLEARYQQQLEVNSEIDLIAHLLSCNEDFKVGPGRADVAINGFLESKMDLVDTVLNDEDKELLHSKYTIAKRLKQILGPENWEKYKCLFPLLEEYWDD